MVNFVGVTMGDGKIGEGDSVLIMGENWVESIFHGGRVSILLSTPDLFNVVFERLIYRS